MDRFPWYEIVSGDELSQGDILPECPKPILRSTWPSTGRQFEITCELTRVIVLTQSCDLALHRGKAKVDDVILCPVYRRDEMADDAAISRDDYWEEARKGRYPAVHVLNQCPHGDLNGEYLLVDLARAFSISFSEAMLAAAQAGSRARLNPPYREHLSQAFARFFMRVGLPVDIPSFRAKKSGR